MENKPTKQKRHYMEGDGEEEGEEEGGTTSHALAASSATSSSNETAKQEENLVLAMNEVSPMQLDLGS